MLLDSYVKQTYVRTNIKKKKRRNTLFAKGGLFFCTLFLMSCNSVVHQKNKTVSTEDGVYSIQQEQSQNNTPIDVTQIKILENSEIYNEILKRDNEINAKTKSDDMTINHTTVAPKMQFKTKIAYHKFICKGNKEKTLAFYYLYELNEKTENMDLKTVSYDLGHADKVSLKLQNTHVKQTKNGSEENLIFKQTNLKDGINGYYQWEITPDRKQGSLSLISTQTGKVTHIYSKCEMKKNFG